MFCSVCAFNNTLKRDPFTISTRPYAISFRQPLWH